MAEESPIGQAVTLDAEDWEFELDLMGSSASFECLTSHLRVAPDPNSELAQYLRNHLAEMAAEFSHIASNDSMCPHHVSGKLKAA